MIEDGRYRIWVGSETGLYCYDGAGALIRTPDPAIGAIERCYLCSAQPADSNCGSFFASTNFLAKSWLFADGGVNNHPRDLGLQENEFNTCHLPGPCSQAILWRYQWDHGLLLRPSFRPEGHSADDVRRGQILRSMIRPIMRSVDRGRRIRSGCGV